MKAGEESGVNPVSGLMALVGSFSRGTQGKEQGPGDGHACWPPQHEMGTEREVKATARKKIPGHSCPWLLIYTVCDETSGDDHGTGITMAEKFGV